MREETNPVTGMETVAAAPGVEAGQGRPATMQYRPGLVALAFLAALVPGVADATTRVALSIAKSFHPGSARDYSTVHPGLGVTGPLAGEWLRWRAGVVRHSHSRWGPVTGLAATWGIGGNWRAGFSAGIVGNYARGHWFRRGVVPAVQWVDEERDRVWEFALAHNEKVTFVGISVQIPIAVRATRLRKDLRVWQPNQHGEPSGTSGPHGPGRSALERARHPSLPERVQRLPRCTRGPCVVVQAIPGTGGTPLPLRNPQNSL